MKIPAIVACALAFAALRVAAADDVDAYASATGGRPEQFVPPDYPRQALAGGVTGYVDVDATVDGMLGLHDVRFHPGSPEAQVFVPGLQEVAKFWLFHPDNANGRCFPTDNQRISFRVIYEIADGAPRISIELPTPTAKTTKSLQAQCPAPRYPGGALREHLSANVFSRVDIRADGTVANVTSQVYPKDSGERFAEEVESSLRHCRFAPASGDRPRIACYDMSFRVR